MNTRRSFLRFLGIGAVAAPAIVQAAQVAEPDLLIEVVQPQEYLWPDPKSLLAAQAEINTLHSANIESIDNYGTRVWLDWAENAVKTTPIRRKASTSAKSRDLPPSQNLDRSKAGGPFFR